MDYFEVFLPSSGINEILTDFGEVAPFQNECWYQVASCRPTLVYMHRLKKLLDKVLRKWHQYRLNGCQGKSTSHVEKEVSGNSSAEVEHFSK